MTKNERRIEENSDFVIVNSLVWNVLLKLYKGGPEIKLNTIKFFFF